MSCECSLYSFDIFDTLITRKVATPKGIFVLMQHKIQTSEEFSDFTQDFKNNFYYHRTNAEFRQRHFYKVKESKKDITFDNIYNDLKENFHLSDEQCVRLKQLEIQTELENIIPITENINKVRALLQKEKRVILISDMYLPEDVIRKMIDKCAPELANLKLYLSSAIGFMKQSGEIFKYVQAKENIEFADWKHFGDNRYSDYVNPLSYGIKADLYHYINLKKYEKDLLQKYPLSPVIQLMIGCAKNIRLEKYKYSDKYHLGSSIAGPLFYPYISWLLKQAQQRNIGCLFFVARDGYVLKEIADILIKTQNLDIKTIYIYGSKKAWRVPALDLNNEILKEQFVETLLWTYKKLDKVLGLTYKEVCNALPKKFHSYRNGLSKSRIAELKQFLLSDNKLLLIAVERNKNKRKNAVAYLKQIVNMAENRNFAFVDIDGTRFSMNCMSALIHDFYDKELIGFYMASTPTVFEPIGIQYNHFYCLKRSLLGHVLELLVRAPHGQTLGYQEVDGKYEPILEQISPKIFEDWQFNDYIAGMLDFVKQYSEYQSRYEDEFCFENIQILEHFIYFLTLNVDKDTANLLGSIIHNLYGNESGEFASSIGFRQAVKYLLTNKINTENILYSKMRSHKLIRRMIEYKQSHPDLRKELINIFIHKRQKQAYMKLLGIKISFRHLLWKDV